MWTKEFIEEYRPHAKKIKIFLKWVLPGLIDLKQEWQKSSPSSSPRFCLCILDWTHMLHMVHPRLHPHAACSMSWLQRHALHSVSRASLTFSAFGAQGWSSCLFFLQCVGPVQGVHCIWCVEWSRTGAECNTWGESGANIAYGAHTRLANV